MAGFALRLLLATYGTAHAARHSLVANLNTTAARHSSVAKHNATASGAAGSNATDPGVIAGGIWNLENNEYMLEWSESADSWAFYEKVKEDRKWSFITPVMCRTSGIWYKIQIKHSSLFKNCLLVTCNLEGNVEKIEPQRDCYEFTSKVFRTYGPYVTRSTDWALFHVPHFKKQLPAIDTSKAMFNGWAFDSLTVETTLKKHEPRHYYDFMDEGLSNKYGWGFSKKCEGYKALWKQVDGLTFTTKASLETCKTKRIEARKSCVSKYQPFVGTTAWGVKKLIETRDLFRFESCKTWCAKNDCYKKDAPEGVKRDTKAFMEAMNSWKYACEQELDILVANKLEACNNIGSICDKPWAKFLPCAETYSTPFFYN